MLTMSHSCDAASEQGSGGWKEPYRSTAESVESFEDSVDSDNSSSSSQASRSQSCSSLKPPIGCITTHSVSAVIRPEKKIPPMDPLQFVKIQKNELSKKAVEQIKLAEKVKITKEKIKEVEEEWQNNLMSWKSKRKLTKNNSEDESVVANNANRKTKTFSEILNEKARSGGRIGYNLHRYADVDLEEQLSKRINQKDFIERLEAVQGIADERQFEEDAMAFDQFRYSSELSFDPTESNLNRLLKSNSVEPFSEDEICRNGLGEVVVFDTTLLEEFSVKSDGCDLTQTSCGNSRATATTEVIPSDSFTSESANQKFHSEPQLCLRALDDSGGVSLPSNEASYELPNQSQTTDAPALLHRQQQSSHQKVHVPINEWKSSQNNKPLKQSLASSDEDDPHQNSSFDVEDEEDELDEELEKLRLDQERSFKAKLYAFENLAKQEEEAARKAAESSRRRHQSRQAKLAAERSKSLGNIQQSSSARGKVPVAATHSVSSSSIPVSQGSFSSEPKAISQSKSQLESQSKSLQNLYSPEYPYSPAHNATANSTIYNFTDKVQRPQEFDSLSVQSEPKSTTNLNPSVRSLQAPKPLRKLAESKSRPSETVPPSSQAQAQTIYENLTQMGIPLQTSQPISPSIDAVTDSTAIRNASIQFLQQQQQIYQNQPLSVSFQQASFPQEHYPTGPLLADNFNYYEATGGILQPSDHHLPTGDHPVQPTDSLLNDKVISPVPIRGYPIADDVGLPPIQITKSNQSGTNMPFNPILSAIPLAGKTEEEHLYVNQNQLLLNSQGKNSAPYDYRPNSVTYENYNPGQHYPEPNYENKTFIQKRMEESAANGVYPPNQYLYFPKPYSTANTSVKPIAKQQLPQMVPPSMSLAVPHSQNNVRYAPNAYNGKQRVAYNQNHWLLQEAELRMESSSSWLKNANGIPQPQQQPHSKIAGQPSVSGKKKCSSCMDELGKGCAAMVVESLSLFYHINCFRCSVCNVQLGNGTVGTDVRVRNNKLHCQNCYSNDEAGLKFSRV